MEQLMKQSSAVQLILVTAAAAAMTACKEKSTRYCVDADNRVVEDQQCEDDKRQYNPAHHWYYGGAHGVVVPGTRLSGGSTAQPAEGFSTPSKSGTVRGVIGNAGESAAGHGGEGGGHGGGHGRGAGD